ncbi:MAG: PKD domain-containing protein [Candidatus Woesearchaeota archaeon]
MIALLPVDAFALPDNKPTCSLAANTQDTTNVAVLTVVAVDTLANAGMKNIKIFEDGNLISTKDCASTTTCVSTKTVVHTTEGNHNYIAECRDISQQLKSSDTKVVHFDGLNQPPVIDTFSPTTPHAMDEDASVTLAVTAHDNDGDSLTYEWQVDGSTVSGATASSFDFSANADGTTQRFTVSVFVRDVTGGVDVNAWWVDITDLEPAVTLSGDVSGTECDIFAFDADVDSYDAWSIEWDFGDGTTITNTDASAQHSFADDGDYTVTVTVTDADDDVSTASIDVTVSDVSPTVDAGADQSVIEGDLVDFSADASVVCSADAITSYAWDFGDANTADTADASNTYAQDGAYTVTLTVCDEDDCVSDTLTVDVADTAPVAGFTYAPSSVDEGDAVDFTDASTAYDTPISWEWDFDNDGTVDDTTQDPQNIFVFDGSYDVCLTVTDNDGSQDTFCDTIDVANVLPTVDLVLNVTSGTEAFDVHAECNATGGNAPLTVDIDFGDGNVVNAASADNTYVQDGSYTAICTVTDVDGDIVTSSVPVDVADTEPTADFTWNPLFPQDDSPVDFTSTITAYDMPYTVMWDFGDGNTSTLDNPTNVYENGGDYNVTLTVTDADGSTFMVWHDFHVSGTPPTSDLFVDILSGDEPLTVSVTCTAGGPDAPFTYEVDMGDGTPVYTIGSFLHTYDQNGTYDATCIVTDDDNDQDIDYETIDVFDTVPTVSFNYTPSAPIETMDVDFDATIVSYDAVVDIQWDFGDGDTDVVEDPTHAFANDGIYTVTLTVTDADGSISVYNEDVNVSVNAAIVTLVANTTSGVEALDVQFACGAVSGNAPYTFSIDFGDGSAPEASAVAMHTYAQNGTYTATCEVTDFDGDVSNDVVVIDVIDTVPAASFTFSPALPAEGDTVDFDSTVTAYDANATLEWDFDGDGIADSADEDPAFTYALEGDYNVTLTATDADGSVTVAWAVVSVANNAPLVSLDATPTTGLEGLNVSFDCQYAGGNIPVSFVVDFGDGSPLETTKLSDHVYAAPGNYVATCTVTDTDGDMDSDFVVIDVINNPPVVDLIASPATGVEGDSVDFDCGITAGDEPFTVLLDFGDGTTTNTTTASYTYDLEGIYDATCTVTDDDGDVVVDSELIDIANNAPVVNVATNVTSGLEPLSVNYTCNVGNGNAPFTFVVDFGDGSPASSSVQGTHDFAIPGIYSIMCDVTDVDGDTDFDIVDVEVIDNPPVVTLTAIPTVDSEGVSVDFTCGVVGGNDPLSYVLDFGDGSPVSTSANDIHVYALEGSYNATCTVTDADLDVGMDNEIITVNNNVPVVNLHTNVTSGVEALDVAFNCTSAGGNAPFTYSLDFGDGSAPIAASTASHSYAQNSTYDATCTITDVDGDLDVDVASLIVFDSEPDTNFTYAPAIPVEGDLVQFTDATTAFDGVVAWSWDFGDGNTSTLQDPTKTYDIEGSYLVVLTTTDGDGSQTSHIENVVVGNNVPVVDVIVTPVSGTEPLTVTVDCAVTSGGNAPFSYLVMYGDGKSNTSTSSVYTYTQDGNYPVTCQVTDVDGDVSSDLAAVTVNDTVPTADFSWTPANPSAGEQVNFTDLSTGYDAIVDWAWDFQNDGVVDATSSAPAVTFVSPGLYSVNLTVTDADGSTASTLRAVAVNVSIPAPVIFSVTEAGVTNVSANITWGTDQATDSLVEFGITTALGTSVSDAAIVFNHNLQLTGLAPSTLYYYNVTSCNTFGTCSTSGLFNFTTLASGSPGDVVAPVVTLSAPADASTDTDGDVTVQYSVTDDLADPLSCDVYSNTTGTWQADLVGQSTVNATSNTHAYVGLADGTYRWNVECSDGTNSAFAVADFTFVVNTAIVDVIAPVVTLSAPADASVDNDGNVTVQYSVNDDLAASLSCDVYSDTSGAWIVDAAGQIVANASSSSFNYVGLADGSYTWNVDCSDGTNSAFAAANFTFDVNTTSAPSNVPSVTASATPTGGAVPLTVTFNATATGGDAPLSYAWDFDNDGTVDSTVEDPVAIYNLAGTFTAVVNVTDADGDWATDNVTITASSTTRDISVNTITHSNVGTTSYLWDSIDVTSNVQNQGGADETVTMNLEVNGIVVDSSAVLVTTGATVPVTLNYNATLAGTDVVVVRAVPLAGESDLSDQTRATTIRVWSVDDIVSSSTREIFLTSTIVLAGGTFSAYLPVQNDYGVQNFDDLQVSIWSSNLGAFSITSPVQLVDLAGGEFELVQWGFTANTAGTYVISASLGNNEIDASSITSKIITVI